MIKTEMFDLTGKVALLTGASKGMGLAMARGLAAHGAQVMISSRKLDACDAAAGEINASLGETRVHALACNAGRREDLEALVEGTRAALGPITVLVGNAGVNPHYGPMSEIPDAAYDKIMATNVRSNHWLAHMVAPDMVGGGSMMFTASVGAYKPSLQLGTYGMSKLALIGLVRNLAQEYGPRGVRANAICPGLIKTDFARALWESPEATRRVTEDIPLGRLGEAEDLAGLAVFLASDASAYISGQAMTVCGGSYMWT